MKSEVRFLAGVFGMAAAVFLLGHLFDRPAQADTGREAAVRAEVGSYGETRSVSISSSASTLVVDVSVKRPDETCFNNSAYTIWLGSQAAGVTLSNFGFPILSSATFRLGAFTGSLYALQDSAAGGAGNVRCWDGLVR